MVNAPNRDASDRVLDVIGKLSTRRGCMGFDSMTFGLAVPKVLEY